MNTKLRPGIAMIELIFALVIIGITLMSAPMLISTAEKSGYVAIQQEAINEAATQVNMIMGYHWDQNTADERFLDPILMVSSGVSDLAEVNTTSNPNTGRRLGTPTQSYRTFIINNSRLSASTIPSTGNNNKNDITDFIGDTNLTLIKSSSSEYIETTSININTAISYSEDNVSSGYNQSSIVFNPFTASGGTTNIKSIIVSLTSLGGVSELDKNIVLRAFSSNIGGYILEERDVN